MTLSNLPPGVSDSDIPGNRPEDVVWEKAEEAIDIIEVCKECRDECDYAKWFAHEPFADLEDALYTVLDSGWESEGWGGDAQWVIPEYIRQRIMLTLGIEVEKEWEGCEKRIVDKEDDTPFTGGTPDDCPHWLERVEALYERMMDEGYGLPDRINEDGEEER